MTGHDMDVRLNGRSRPGLWLNLLTGEKKPGRTGDDSLAGAIQARGYAYWE
jgi:hypothetical protein